MMYRFLLFDLDGTLFDYKKAEAVALQQSCLEYGIPFEQAFLEEYNRINKQIWREYEQGNISQAELKVKRFTQFADCIGISFDAEAFSETYLDYMSLQTQLVDGAETIVPLLSDMYKLVLITNGLKRVQQSRITKSVLGPYFEQIIISEEAGCAKPDRKIFDLTFQRIHNPPKREVLLIGDSLTSDIAGGYTYGIDTCWFNNSDIVHRVSETNIKPTYEIRYLRELLDIVPVNKENIENGEW